MKLNSGWSLQMSLFVLSLVAVLDDAHFSTINANLSQTELGDLNKIPIKARIKFTTEEIPESSNFTHHNEDALHLITDLNLDQSLKYDVEILQVSDTNKETVELEERFRGAAIHTDTNYFQALNIEVNGGGDSEQFYVEDATDGDDTVESNHMILTMIIIFMAVVSISLYASLVIWRSHLEQRYGMRELLVTNDDDFYLPSNSTTERQW